MGEHFLADFFNALVGAGVGSALTVFFAWRTLVGDRKERELQQLRALMHDLAHRRALTLDRHPKMRWAARRRPGYGWASLSVLAMKDLVKTTQQNCRPRANTLDPLSAMITACNDYLETTAKSPQRYKIELMRLRAQLRCSLIELSQARGELEFIEPGGLSFKEGS